MIEIRNLDKCYNMGKGTEIQALKQINLTVTGGEFVVVVGSNGSGKSTLLNVIAGSVVPDSGLIFLDKTNVTGIKEHLRTKFVSRVFQNPLAGTASDLTILDNFRLAALRTQPKTLRIGVNEVFRRVVREKIAGLNMGLEDKVDQLMGTLSGGQRQALTLLMSVMDKGNILLLDEPTAALDPRSAKTVMQIADKLIAEYRLTGILITHNIREAYTYGSRIIQMKQGELIRDLDTSAKANLSNTEIYEWFD